MTTRRTIGTIASGLLVLGILIFIGRGRPEVFEGPAITTVGVTFTQQAKVVRIVDGDTIRVEVNGANEPVRLVGIDTPEVVKPGAPVECFGPEASAGLTSKVPIGATVTLVRDVSDRDGMQTPRLLRYVQLADGTDVGLWMIWQGYAKSARYKPDTARADQYDDVQAAARRAGRGLWSACE